MIYQTHFNFFHFSKNSEMAKLIESKMAPLAEPENDEVSKTDSLITISNDQDNRIISKTLESIICESDVDDDDDCDDTHRGEIHLSTSSLTIDKKMSNDSKQKQSLDDLLDESIEIKLEKINNLNEQEQESFLVYETKSNNECAKNSITIASPLERRCSQYDNEQQHDCYLKHFGYQRNVDMLMLKSVYQKLDLDQFPKIVDEKNVGNRDDSVRNTRPIQFSTDANGSSTEGLSKSLPTTSLDHVNRTAISNTMIVNDKSSDSVVLRHKSSKFPLTNDKINLEDVNDDGGIDDDDLPSESNYSNSSTLLSQTSSRSDQQQRPQHHVSNHRRQPKLRDSSISNGSGAGSQRPLTLYLPVPNQKINLITHLHALGHDLTSAIVTNHLLLTPYTCSGYLYKHCTSSVGKWRKRYFHFDRVRKVFVYYHDRSDFDKMRHPKRKY